VVAEVRALHDAIAARDVPAAAQLWREKFERWIRDLVGRLGEDFDDELWVALTRGAGTPR
jgi:DNA-binding GntR family transcriptional regulator